MTEPLIRRLDAAAVEGRLGDLAAVLVDAVAHGASVNFMAGLTEAEAAAFWRRQLPGVAEGETQLLVAEDGGLRRMGGGWWGRCC